MFYSDIDNNQLLDALDAERRRFTQADQNRITMMVMELQIRGVYPTDTARTEQIKAGQAAKLTVAKMVDCYGARWHEGWIQSRATGLLNCPHCHADLRDQKNGAPFLRKIGETRNDRTALYHCPDCKKTWSRAEDDACIVIADVVAAP